MSKKSGFFYLMAVLFSSMFTSHTYKGGSSPFQPTASRSDGGGDGKTIRSYGTKPAYMKDKVLYKNWGDRIYVSVGHSYWRTRALAEANR